jgi:predicted DCC family thiol-disulfide oxidoreductase YuxK
MRALAVLYCYPPLLVPASICYLKLVTALQSQGVEVDIVTIDPSTFASPGPIPLDPSLETIVPPVGRHFVVRSPETSLWVKTLKRLDPTRRFTYRKLEPKKREWVGPALEELNAADLSQYDVLITCSQPHCNHLIGLELQEKFGIPWVAYFSDPWTDSPYILYARSEVREFNRRLEDSILARADRVLYTCEEMRDLIVSRHPGLDSAKTGVLPHSFVSEWYDVADTPEVDRFDGVKLLQTGSFYGPRTPMPVIDVLARLHHEGRVAGRLRIDSYGGMAPEHEQAIAEAGLSEIFRVQGFLPYLQTLPLMRANDTLLLVDAALTSTEENVFLPSKLIDYLGSRTPILAVTPEQGATARVVQAAGGTVCPIEDRAGVERVFESLLDGGALVHQVREDGIECFDHRRVGAALRIQLEEVAR